MVALKTSETDSYLRRPGHPVVLIFGPDAGLVGERADALIQASVDDANDPFSLVRLDGEDLTGNPYRLVEEANTVPLFGGRRAVHLKAGGRNILPAVEALLAAPSPDCRVVIEAGELRKTAPLRVICEKAKNAAAIACYADDASGLARLLDEELKNAGLSIMQDARAALMPFLGGDRQASRSEIRKLALYAHGRGEITIDDVFAIVADASDLALDDAVDAAFAGKPADVELHFKKARAAGTSPGTIMLAALRQTGLLHRLRLMVDAGASADQAINAARPPLHFRRRSLVETALTTWSSAKLLRVFTQLSDTLLESRRQSDLAEALTQRALVGIAQSARRRN
ncbi:MAG: DNA polymerase III subunit delta [Pseudorhodoplanes sp.]|nr:DNA polymerase III subunit delta [Pseudorhodoplanes sp.]